ncbi:hypothetical protein KUCAC02_021740 [Chaenocephalus aceratus]|uniref:Uncharacterized protein n=1 Tax=Chaenocephalus aceratus TaxID=36190 RepID=A0ACB9XHD1_CHAAC|nr:hypothetical protein KUCAC02_021740 [Chaenocephalus aceratus]
MVVYDLFYNKTTRQSSNSPGVQVRVPGFGQTYPIEFIDYNRLAGYFHTMVQHLVNVGYTRNETVRGAPYDWRLAPNENAEYLSKLPQTGGGDVRGVPEACVPAGTQHGLPLRPILPQPPASGLERQIHQGLHFPSSSMGGALSKYSEPLSSGENDGIPMISILKIREEQRMKPTNPWILPTKAWPSDHVFISTPTMNYTNQDYQRLFTDINYEDGWHMWEDTKNLTGDLYPPGVEVWCMYGVGLPTPVTYIYDEEFPNKDPVDFVYADGDDTVDSFSMSLCKQWAEQAGAACACDRVPRAAPPGHCVPRKGDHPSPTNHGGPIRRSQGD